MCESMHVLRNLASNIAHTGQINFQERFKTPSLDVLKKYMREVEALRFLHNVVNLDELKCKLKGKNFPGNGEKIVEEVRLCIDLHMNFVTLCSKRTHTLTRSGIYMCVK